MRVGLLESGTYLFDFDSGQASDRNLPFWHLQNNYNVTTHEHMSALPFNGTTRRLRLTSGSTALALRKLNLFSATNVPNLSTTRTTQKTKIVFWDYAKHSGSWSFSTVIEARTTQSELSPPEKPRRRNQSLIDEGATMRQEYDFSNAKKNPYSSQLKKQVTIRLDEEAINYFKLVSDEVGIPYQRLINLYLRDCAASRRKLNLNWK